MKLNKMKFRNLIGKGFCFLTLALFLDKAVTEVRLKNKCSKNGKAGQS
jgi:hypothetical protein